MADPKNNPAATNPFEVREAHFSPMMMPSAAPTAPVATNALPAPKNMVFVSERTRLPDALGRMAALERIAQLVAHKGAHGPLTIAVLGGLGSGKTYALAQIVDMAGQLSRLAEKTGAGPFTPRLSVVPMDASELGAKPAVALAARINTRLGADYPTLNALVSETVAAAQADPQSLARQSASALEGARKSLNEAQRLLDGAQSRRARLNETLIYETSGSQFDSWARANRGRIETALRAFGFSGADPLADYRGLVHTLSESGGLSGQLAASLRALWAYRGQTKRWVWAGVFYVAQRLLASLANDPSWLSQLAQLDDQARPVAHWLRNQLWFLEDAHFVALILMWVCVGSALWRAWRFAHPLWRGVRLLDDDLERRRGELEREIAHHAQRVDFFTREVDMLTTRLANQERRVGGLSPSAALAEPLFAAPECGSSANARAYFAALNKAMTASGVQSAQAAPTRIVVAIDGLETCSPQRAVEILSELVGALALPAFGLIAAFDPYRLDSAQDGGGARRLFQLCWTVPEDKDQDWRAFIKQLDAPPPSHNQTALDNRSELDKPLTDGEHRLLSQLAGLAGPSPRNVARMVNAYRLARFDAAGDKAALALMLALRIGGTAAERAAMAVADQNAPDMVFKSPHEASARLCAGVAAVNAYMASASASVAPSSVAVETVPLTRGAILRADALARMWTYADQTED